MALHWDVTKVKNNAKVCWSVCKADNRAAGLKAGETYMTSVTSALIHITMSVGIGFITTANAAEFWARLRFLMELDNWSKESRLKWTDVQAHIGLVTNVSLDTRAAWSKRISKSILDSFSRQYTILVEESAEKGRSA